MLIWLWKFLLAKLDRLSPLRKFKLILWEVVFLSIADIKYESMSRT